MPEPPRRSRLPHVLLAGYLVLCLGALVWPGLALAQAHGPATLLGLPFAFGWSVAWVVATFVAMALYHYAVGRGSD